MDEDQFRAWRHLLADYLQAFVVGTSQGKDISRFRAEVVALMAESELFKRVHSIPPGKRIEVGNEPLPVAARNEANPHQARAFGDGCNGTYPSGASSVWLYVRNIIDR